MNEQVRAVLAQLVQQFGTELCTNGQKLEGLLRDFCGNHRREIHVLLVAARLRVAEEVARHAGGRMEELAWQRQVSRLYDETGMAEEFATWAVRAWADALGVEVAGAGVGSLQVERRPPPNGGRPHDEGQAPNAFPKVVQVFRGHTQRVPALRFTPDGRTIVSGSWDNFVKLWEVASGTCQRTLSGHTYSVKAVAVAPDGARMATGGAGARELVKVFRLPEGGLVQKIQHPDQPSTQLASVSVQALAYAPDGALLAAGARGTRLYETASGQLLRQFGDGRKVNAVAFSPDGRLVAAASDTLEVWRVADGQLVHRIGHAEARPTVVGSQMFLPKVTVDAVAFSPDGQHVTTGGNDRTVKVWQLANGRLLHTLEAHTNGVFALAYSPDGQFLATGGADRVIHLWRADGQWLCSMHNPGGVDVLAFSPDGKWLAAGGTEPEFHLWQLYA